MSHAVGKVLQLVARLLARDGFRGLAGLLGCRGHGLYRGDRAAGLLCLDVSTCRYSASRLSASLSVLPEWRTLGKPTLDFGITLIEFGAGDALGLVVSRAALNFAL